MNIYSLQFRPVLTERNKLILLITSPISFQFYSHLGSHWYFGGSVLLISLVLWVVLRLFCFVCLRPVSCVPVSLDGTFLIALSDFSNVYCNIHIMFRKKSLNIVYVNLELISIMTSLLTRSSKFKLLFEVDR